MTEKVACKECGALILATTAATNNGLCMPCKRGIRKNLEDGKRRYEERKRMEANPDPAKKHWRWLVQQVHHSAEGFGGLSEKNKLYFAAVLLEGEVYNGGFDQYFHNSSADYFAYAARGLDEMGAPECRRILETAKQLIFGAGDVPGTQAERFARVERTTAQREMKLTELDRQFVAAAAGMHDLVAEFARRHALYKG
jgi:hypothetical protein